MRLKDGWLLRHGFAPGDVLIETGTKEGHGARRVAHLFREVHTVELDERRYKDAVFNLRQTPNVHCWFGDSAQLMPKLIAPGRQTVFWLDAHPMDMDPGGIPVDAPCPLMGELQAIFAVTWRVRPVILIDDARMFQKFIRHRRLAKKGYDVASWPTDEQIRGLAHAHDFRMTQIDDAFVLG